MFTYNKSFSSFSVNDLQKAKLFYSKVLGVKVTDQPMGVIELQMENEKSISVYPKPDHVPATFTVLNFTVNDINETVDTLTKQGVRFEQYTGNIQTNEKGICKNPDGMSIAWFKDPAGNILSVIEEG